MNRAGIFCVCVTVTLLLSRYAVLLEAATYAAFRTPVQITPGRLVKFTLFANF